jgi:hypothetical protein
LSFCHNIAVNMSRHRLVKNLDQDDYYDDYDDYDDDDYYEDYDDSYTPPPKKAPAPKAATAKPPATKTIAAKIAIPGKAAVTTSVGVVKPPPGWGKPSAAPASPPKSPSTIAASGSGVIKPPPGWGAPSLSPPAKAQASAVEAASHQKQRSATSRSKSPKPNQGGAAALTPYTPRPIPDFVANSKSQLSMVIL